MHCSSQVCVLIIIITAQIAKDMERWAKTVNAAKSVQQQQLQAVIQQERSEAVPEPTLIGTSPDTLVSLSGIKRTGVPLASALHNMVNVTAHKFSTTSIIWQSYIYLVYHIKKVVSGY